ncbi:MAG: Na+:solute symporter, partial [Kiritimatiellae bacterium]|nr:Na+:solute symporter [Kiritimatiellia bacterium]
GNWYWWSGVMGFMLCACLFARMWQRAHLVTDAEIYELRYDGAGSKALRSFNAAFRSIFSNCITMGWVTLAMTKIIAVLLDLPSLVVLRGGGFRLVDGALTLSAAGLDPAAVLFVADEKIIGVLFCILIALTYATISGMWGVVATDLVQFVIAMIGSISLAVIAVVKLGGPAAMRAAVLAAIDQNAAAAAAEGLSPLCASGSILRFAPDISGGGLALATFVIFVTVQWWGGSEGGGFLAQRLFACRNERHGALAVLWFSFAHFVIRVWPWIIVGLASIVFFPKLADAEMAYPMMIGFMPVGLRGLMVASLLAAFMSTIDTHLNWGASYLVNDIYKRFLVRGRTEHHYVRVAQVASVLMMVLAGVTAMQMKSIYSAWLYLAEIGAGVVLATLLRWFWWRVNAWSEISAMVASLILANGFRIVGGLFNVPFLCADEWYAVRMVVVLAVCTVIWIVVTFLTEPVSRARLREFYARVQPGGCWGPVREPGDPQPEKGHGWRIFGAWCYGVVSVYCLLIGTGKVLLAEPAVGWALIAAGLAAGYLLVRNMLIETRTR